MWVVVYGCVRSGGNDQWVGVAATPEYRKELWLLDGWSPRHRRTADGTVWSGGLDGIESFYNSALGFPLGARPQAALRIRGGLAGFVGHLGRSRFVSRSAWMDAIL